MPTIAQRPATRAFRTTVARTTQLSPHFVRITLTGEDLQDFGPAGVGDEAEPEVLPAWDQRIKLFLPRADGSFADVGLFADPPPSQADWYGAWRQLDQTARNPIRTYTVRAIRPAQGEVDVDFVLHGEDPHASGPASSWAMGARPGDALIIIGPDRWSAAPGGGIDFTPGSANNLLLVGDETAAPAICAILEALPESFGGEAYIEVPTAEDALDVETAARVSLTWLPRGDAPLGELLTAAVHAWGRARAQLAEAEPVTEEAAQELPDVDEELLWETAAPQGFGQYAWLAGEAGVITGLRRHLVKELGLSRKQVSFMGYWRRGRASA